MNNWIHIYYTDSLGIHVWRRIQTNYNAIKYQSSYSISQFTLFQVLYRLSFKKRKENCIYLILKYFFYQCKINNIIKLSLDDFSKPI